MLLTPHLLAGAAIASKIDPPFFAFILAFLSHFFLDFLPHWEYSTRNLQEKIWSKALPDFSKASFDFFLGFLLIFLLSKNILLGLAGGFAGVLPDALSFLHFLLPKSKALTALYSFHHKKVHFLKTKKIPVFWGIFSQAAVIALAIFFLQ